MILTGWKEIGLHLRCAPRTAQRWERSGLPVKRPIPGQRSHIIADSELLDAWLRHSEFWRNQGLDRLTHIYHGRSLRAEVQQSRQTLLARMATLRRQVATVSRGLEKLHQQTLFSAKWNKIRNRNCSRGWGERNYSSVNALPIPTGTPQRTRLSFPSHWP